MTLVRVISGGQTGVDQAALRAARAAGIPPGGTAPKGWLTEDGPAPWLAEFGLTECWQPGYPARTWQNVHNSDGTLWIGRTDSKGFTTTEANAYAHKMPFLIVQADVTTVREVRAWIEKHNIKVLNVAGNRESVWPGIGERAERFLQSLFATLTDVPYRN
jgi:hypothetical protein